MQPTYRGLESSSHQAETEASVKFPMLYRGQRPEVREAQEEGSDLDPDASREVPEPNTHDQNRSSPMSQLVHAFCQGNWGFLDRWLARQFYRLSRWFRQQRF